MREGKEAACCRLDRFLFSADFEVCFPNSRQSAFVRLSLDRWQIEFVTTGVRFGPVPFRFVSSGWHIFHLKMSSRVGIRL